MGNTYNGNPANGARSPAIAITEPVDADPQAAATYNLFAEKEADYIAWLQLHAACIDLSNVFTAANTFNGTAGATSNANDILPAIQTSYVPNTRKCLWQAQNGLSQIDAIYDAFGVGLEVVTNATWNGTQWVQANGAVASCRLAFGNNGLCVLSYKAAGAAAWADGAWTKTLTIDATVVQSIDAQGVTASGALTTDFGYNAKAQAMNDVVGSFCSFRKAFTSAPSSFTFVANVVNTNITNGGVAAGYTWSAGDAYGAIITATAAAAGTAQYLTRGTVQ